MQRVAKIVKGFKEFSHPGSEDKRAINLNQAIETTIAVTRHEWKYCAEVVTAFDAALPMVPCLVGEFNQVMLNLIINSTHAISNVVEAARRRQRHYHHRHRARRRMGPDCCGRHWRRYSA